MKKLVAILSCHSLRHCEQAERDTWIKDIPAGVDYKFFLGNREGVHDSSLHLYEKDEAHLNVGDGWQDITKKSVAIYQWSLDQGYDFVWKMDLDTLVRPRQLLGAGLEVFDWVGGRNSFFASGGAGYGLSRRAMEYVVSYPIGTTCEEDVHTAHALLAQGIQLHDDGRFKFYPGDTLEPQDLTMHLSSVRGWAVKFQVPWMYEAHAAVGTYGPLMGTEVKGRRLRRLR